MNYTPVVFVGFFWSIIASFGDITAEDTASNTSGNFTFNVSGVSDGFNITLFQPANNSELLGSQLYSFNFTIIGSGEIYNATLQVNGTPVAAANDVLNNRQYRFK